MLCTRSPPVELLVAYNCRMNPPEIVTKIRELIGLSASFGGYRNDLPASDAESRYQELWAEVDAALAALGERGINFHNPNPHRQLAAMWAWIWAEGGSGRDRKERPAALYADLIAKLQLLDAGAPHEGDGSGAAGLPPRARLQEQLGRAVATGELVSLVFLDLDGFKSVNDRGGHQEGDRCLDAVVGSIQAVVRARGVAFRYGGDEFAVILPNATAREATSTAERLRVEVAQVGSEFGVTASVGVASSDADDIADGPSLIAAADEAAYVSKFSGKNRTTTWPIEPAVRDAVSRLRASAQGR